MRSAIWVITYWSFWDNRLRSGFRINIESLFAQEFQILFGQLRFPQQVRPALCRSNQRLLLAPFVDLGMISGKEYVRKIEETSRNEIEVKVNKLTAGKTYSFTVTGVRKKGTSEYVTVTGTFKA